VKIKAIGLLATAVLLPAACTIANADTIFDNTTSYVDGTDPFSFVVFNDSATDANWDGVEFNTGADTTLTGFTVALANHSSPSSSALTVELLQLGSGTITNGKEVGGFGIAPSGIVLDSASIFTSSTAGTLVSLSLPNWTVSANANYELALVAPTGGVYDLIFPSSSSTTPYASVTGANPVPLPTAAWLMLSGLGGLGVLARKKRTA
jgi:hypothetical protein